MNFPKRGLKRLKTALDRFPYSLSTTLTTSTSLSLFFFPLDFVLSQGPLTHTHISIESSCLTTKKLTTMTLSMSSTTSRRSVYLLTTLSIAHTVRLIASVFPSPLKIGERRCVCNVPDAMLGAPQERPRRDQEYAPIVPQSSERT